MLSFVVIGVGILFLTVIVFSASANAQSKMRNGDTETAQAAQNDLRSYLTAASIGGLLVLGGAGLLGLAGSVLRLIGFVQWLWVPVGSAKAVAMILLLGEIAMGGGFVIGFLGSFLHPILAFIGTLVIMGCCWWDWSCSSSSLAWSARA